MAPPANCGICLETVSKYKCPTCRIPYCSLACWKSHKQSPCALPTPPANLQEQSPPQPPARRESGALEQLNGVDPDSLDKVPPERLARLEESQAVKGMLRNPHLCGMLEHLYRQEDPAEAMESAMQEPIFLEFVEECLDIVEDKNGDKREKDKTPEDIERVIRSLCDGGQ